MGPKKFDPAQTADELWAKAQTDIPANAQQLGEVVPAMHQDLEAPRRSTRPCHRPRGVCLSGRI